MQLSLALEAVRSVEAIHQRLRRVYGAPSPVTPPDPVSQLVRSMLGSRTKDEDSGAAFVALRRQFGTWEALRDAPAATLEPLMRRLTFPDNKAAFLPAALRTITARRGALDLDFLGDRTVESAQGWLLDLPGVGPKISAAVLNFSSLRMRALVVDTHHYRVAGRLGLLPPGTGYDASHRRLFRQLPDVWTADQLRDHQVLMKLHGQTICHDTGMACPHCRLRDLCTAQLESPSPPFRGEKDLG